MDKYIDTIESELLGTINKDNDLTLRDTDVSFSGWVRGEDKVAVFVKGQMPFYDRKIVDYKRRDLAAFFLGIPVAIDKTKLSTDFTGQDLVVILNSYWPGLIDVDDIDGTWLETHFNQSTETVEMLAGGASLRWTGKVTIYLVTSVQELSEIWLNTPRIYSKGISLHNVLVYTRDYSSYGRMIQDIDEEGPALEEFKEYTNVLKDFTMASYYKFFYNGPVDKIPEPLTGMAKDTFKNVLILIKDVSTSEVLYMHYGRK